MGWISPRRLLILNLILLLTLAASCGGDAAEKTPIELQQSERDQITTMAKAYVASLQARDMNAAKMLLISGVPDATVTKSIDTVRNEGYRLETVGSVTADAEGAEILLNLTDKNGKTVVRKLEFRRVDGTWVVYSPHLKPLT